MGESSLLASPPTQAFQDRIYRYTVPFAGSGLTYSLEGAPSWLSINPATGEVSGTPSQPQIVSSIRIVASSASERKVSEVFGIEVLGDPFTQNAWHLNNVAQSTFAKNAGRAGEDLKVKSALAAGYTGAGVTVAVSDTGLQLGHEDMVGNTDLAISKNYAGSAPYAGSDPSPSGTSGDHGTSVAGIIGARGWNGIGTRGIAPEVKLAGLNFLLHYTKAGVLLDQVTGSYDLFNQSWGSSFSSGPVYYSTVDPNYKAQVEATATSGRNGKGSIIVRAAGNDYNHRRIGLTSNYRSRSVNGEEENVMPEVIVVGALNANGKKSSYSSHGAALWISGLGGEYGSTDPAILTTDVSGCDRGYSRSSVASVANQFEIGMNGNTDCNYTTIFNGTSSAAPSIVGVIALMLQANPNLTVRDVKHILAGTASQVDSSFVPTRFVLDPAGYLSEPGWLVNKAGYHFHNWYGFGRANAEAAVTAAKNYVSQLGTQQKKIYDRPNVNLAINDSNVVTPTGVDSVVVSENWILEAVQVELTVTHTYTGDLGVELISPSGTKSILFHTNSSFNTANFSGVTFLSNAFYGETANFQTGSWQLRVVDGAPGDTGTLTSWKLILYGHTP